MFLIRLQALLQLVQIDLTSGSYDLHNDCLISSQVGES